MQPQSQINKCHNEKRRRELENEYIEQLGEFLQINKRDMTACKPDKAAILSEVVKKVSTWTHSTAPAPRYAGLEEKEFAHLNKKKETFSIIS